MAKTETWSSKSYETTRKKVNEKGSATFLGEQHVRSTGKIHPMVDPKKHRGMRESLRLLTPKEDKFVLEFAIPLPDETDVDLTGSMGDNVELTFAALPRRQNYLVLHPKAIFRNGIYQVQMCFGAIQDIDDRFPYQRAEFEPDNKIEEEMTHLFPEKHGGDDPEDYQLSVYSAAYLTKADIWMYGLKGYWYIVGDERGRNEITPSMVEIFNPETLPQNNISISALCQEAIKKWHIFYLQVGSQSSTTQYWTRALGRERVIILPKTQWIPEVQAVIAGLTEGVLNLQNAASWLSEVAEMTRAEAQKIVNAVSHIPIGAQAALPNFGKLPPKGSIFAKKDDIWPVDSPKVETATKPKKSTIKWKL